MTLIISKLKNFFFIWNKIFFFKKYTNILFFLFSFIVISTLLNNYNYNYKINNIMQFFQLYWDSFFFNTKIYNYTPTSLISIIFHYKQLLNYPLFFYAGIGFFLSSIFSLLFISYLGLYGIFYLNLFILLFFFTSFVPYIDLIFNQNFYFHIKCGKWFNLNSIFKIDFDFFIDNISASFSLLTISIAIFVYIYAFAYFRFEPLTDRLIIFLNLFIISMIFLVSSGNLINLFLGWELIGMTSFFLINFWSVKIGTFKSAFKAFSFNKFSDLFLFFAILLIFNLIFSIDILTFLQQIHLFQFTYFNFFFFQINYIELICLFLLLCAFIKSAQIGAHIWLPDSMEAPVPASALIHSATLVSAGIFLLLRFSPLFELSTFSFFLISLTGAITAFYGGFASMYQSDTKKILAYSTISHCGFLMVIYTTGIIEYVFLYLYIHGFFKAAVFMCIGNVNRLSKNNQDFKRMGLYYKFLPFDCYLTFIGLINLSGLPFTLGFFIKHILLIALNNNFYLYNFILINCVLGALTGLFYSSRLFFSVFFDFKKSKKYLYNYYSIQNLNSNYYSNTSLASNFAIICIFCVSYFIGFLFSFNYLNNLASFSSIFNFFNTNATHILFSASQQNLFSFGYLNYLVVFFIFFICFSTWRQTAIKYKIFNSLGSIVLIIILLFLLK